MAKTTTQEIPRYGDRCRSKMAEASLQEASLWRYVSSSDGQLAQPRAGSRQNRVLSVEESQAGMIFQDLATNQKCQRGLPQKHSPRPTVTVMRICITRLSSAVFLCKKKLLRQSSARGIPSAKPIILLRKSSSGPPDKMSGMYNALPVLRRRQQGVATPMPRDESLSAFSPISRPSC